MSAQSIAYDLIDGEQSGTMTSREREQLAKVVRLRERVARAAAKQRAADLRAEFEEQIARRYSFNEQQTWQAAEAAVTAAVTAANEQIAETCASLGIPREFAPGLHAGWYARGENACNKRRAELRKAASARIDEHYRSALTSIEAKSAEVQTQLLIGGLTSSDARAFVETIPTPEALMPVVALGEIEGRTS